MGGRITDRVDLDEEEKEDEEKEEEEEEDFPDNFL